MLEFAEQDVIIPDGPYEGRPYRTSRQPYARLWFGALAMGIWLRNFATGPVQSGKTLSCFVIPIVYHIFELGETVIIGLPDMNMAGDKWKEDILPVIEASPALRRQLPDTGEGSRGGTIKNAVRFKHGPTLKFMTGGGSDKKRAGFTSRVVVITETDGMDQAGEASREADPITQLEARTGAFTKRTGARPQLYAECTVSTEDGRTWREYSGGTESRIAVPCAKCDAWVTPEREHLVGWREAQSELQAQELARFVCPECGEAWSEDDRDAMNAESRLVHRGQTITPAGEVEGDPPPVTTLGFRWSAFNNLFKPVADIGLAEWKAARATDEDNAEKEMRQFWWCLPYIPSLDVDAPLSDEQVKRRADTYPRGQVPEWAKYLGVGVDVGKYLAHYTVLAAGDGGRSHVVEHGRIDVPGAEFDVKVAIGKALDELRELCSAGWVQQGSGAPRQPDAVLIDSRWETNAVFAWCVQAHRGAAPGTRRRYWPIRGHGTSRQAYRMTAYQPPPRKSLRVRVIGEDYHVEKLLAHHVDLICINVDHWKTWVHKRLMTPTGQPGAMTLYVGLANEHVTFAKHLTAERQVREWVAGEGWRIKWEMVRRQNHWLDASGYAGVAVHLVGFRIVQESEPAPTSPAGWFKSRKLRSR